MRFIINVPPAQGMRIIVQQLHLVVSLLLMRLRLNPSELNVLPSLTYCANDLDFAPYLPLAVVGDVDTQVNHKRIVVHVS
jgi:hypothetical protein